MSQPYNQPPNWQPPQGGGPPPPKKRNTLLIVALVFGGIVLLGAIVLGVVAAIAIPSLLAARRASNESSAIGNLRTLGSAQATYLAEYGDPGSISDLVEEGYLDANWSNGAVRNGYVFKEAELDRTSGSFRYTATPEKESDGTRSFSIEDDYVIRFKEGQTPPPRGGGTPLNAN